MRAIKSFFGVVACISLISCVGSQYIQPADGLPSAKVRFVSPSRANFFINAYDTECNQGVLGTGSVGCAGCGNSNELMTKSEIPLFEKLRKNDVVEAVFPAGMPIVLSLSNKESHLLGPEFSASQGCVVNLQFTLDSGAYYEVWSSIDMYGCSVNVAQVVPDGVGSYARVQSNNFQSPVKVCR